MVLWSTLEGSHVPLLPWVHTMGLEAQQGMCTRNLRASACSSILRAAPVHEADICPVLLRSMWPISWWWDLFSHTISCEAVSVAVLNPLLCLCLDTFKSFTVCSGCYPYCTTLDIAPQCHLRCLQLSPWVGLGLLILSLVSSALKHTSLFALAFSSSVLTCNALWSIQKSAC